MEVFVLGSFYILNGYETTEPHSASVSLKVTSIGRVIRMNRSWQVHTAIETSKAVVVTGRGGQYVCPVRYELHLHIKDKAIPVTRRGSPEMCFL
jgi:hypothetical protein